MTPEEQRALFLAEIRRRIERAPNAQTSYALTRLYPLIERLPADVLVTRMDDLMPAYIDEDGRPIERTKPSLTPRQRADRIEMIEATRRAMGIPDDA